jgi:hypothetical protein
MVSLVTGGPAHRLSMIMAALLDVIFGFFCRMRLNSAAAKACHFSAARRRFA